MYKVQLGGRPGVGWDQSNASCDFVTYLHHVQSLQVVPEQAYH
jgi:hypothetical protein